MFFEKILSKFIIIVEQSTKHLHKRRFTNKFILAVQCTWMASWI